MLEVSAIIGVAAVGALWRMAFEQGRMQRGMDAILKEVQMLRNDLGREVGQLSDRLNDHELRIRQLERQ
jgi:hypothetical protein